MYKTFDVIAYIGFAIVLLAIVWAMFEDGE